MLAPISGSRRDGKSSFRTLTRYLTESRDPVTDEIVPRGEYVLSDNLLSYETTVAEMRSVAFENPRVNDPVYHYQLCWRPDLTGIRKTLVNNPTFAPQEVPIEVPPEVPLTVVEGATGFSPRILQQRKEKKRLVSQSFKLPVDLDDRWVRIATFNRVTKTGILIEALETFLDRLPQPPD